MLKKILIYCIFISMSTLSFGQKAKISFDKTAFDLGAVREDGGKITCEYRFVNNGKAPLLIKYVEATCGCTVPKWNRRPILPHDSGVIAVTFNPKDRPGPFTKKIMVYTNASSPNVVLKLHGEVVGKPVNLQQEYPFAAGDLRLNTDTIRLDQLKAKKQIVNMINTGKKHLSIVSIVKPDYLEVDCTPFTLEKKMIGNLVIRFVGNENAEIKPSDQITIRTSQGERYLIAVVNN